MAFTPDIISSGDYGDIRLSIGLSATDTTNVPDATIEARPYLQRVELLVKRQVTAWETLIDSGDSEYDADRANLLRSGVVLATAGSLAALYFAARVGEEVSRTSVGPFATQYRTGPEWQTLAEDLAAAAARDLQEAESWSTVPERVTLISRAGPTRKAATGEHTMTRTEWREYLIPDALRGRTYPDVDYDD